MVPLKYAFIEGDGKKKRWRAGIAQNNSKKKGFKEGKKDPQFGGGDD